MKKVIANSKAKHLEAGKEYTVTDEIALLLEQKGWIGEEPKRKTRAKAKQ